MPVPVEPAPPPPAPARPPLRSLARFRGPWALALLAVPMLLVVLTDAQIRGDRLASFPLKYIGSYSASIAESAVLWALLLYAASARRGAFRWVAAAFFCLSATLAIGVQIYFHRQYSTYLNLDATLFGTSFSSSLFGQLKADGRNFLISVVPPLLFAIGLVWLGRTLMPSGRTRVSKAARIVTPFAVLAAFFFIPCSYRTVQASTPDVIYFHAIGGLMKVLAGVRTSAQVRPGLRSPPHLEAIARAPTPKRNVLFILTESVRSDASCSDHRETCLNAPAINAAAPGRAPLMQMRSNASTTAIELAVLWSGLQPVASREALHSAPLLFDYARAAGVDDAYWTSHHMMFANSRLFVQDLPTSKQCGATDLDPLADIDLGARDDLLGKRVQEEIGSLKEPFFGVAHFGNTHVPYLIDPADAPFQPSVESKSPDDIEGYHNYYRNAVHRQDKIIGDLIRAVRASPLGDRTVLVFTSDHGEAFREHGQLGHTGSILDEEIHVPFWIDAPKGTLTEEEEKSLAALRDTPVFHTDVTPTILDLLGVLDSPAIAPYRKTMIGSSLLRARPVPPALAMSNCSGIWGCAFRNWGMMQGSLKLEGREWDNQWHCYDVLSDPEEKHDLGLAACGELPLLAEKQYGGLPSVIR